MNAYNIGRSAYMAGNYGEAATAFRWAAGLDPDNPIYCHSAALSAARAGDEAEAERLYRRALAGTERTLGDSHPFMLLVARDLADLHEKKGRSEKASELAGRVVALASPLAVAQSGDKTLGALADLCDQSGNISTAVPFYRAALASRRDQYGDSHPKTVSCAVQLAKIHGRLGDNGKARELLEKVGFVREAGNLNDVEI